MNYTLFFILLSFLIGFSLWIGKRAGKGAKTNEDYFLAGRGLGLFPLTMTLLATQLGGGALMGAAEEAYLRGWAVFFYPLGMVIGLMVLGLGFGAKMRSLGLSTVAEIFQKIYRSKSLQKTASTLSIVSLFFILVAQAIAAKKFFGSLGIEGNLLYTGFWIAVVLYTTFGGLKGVVQTDILQALFILVALSIVGFSLFSAPPIEAVERAVVETGSIPWLSWLLMPLLFMLIGQDMGQRCFSAKGAKTISFASILASLLLFACSFCPIFVGCAAAKGGIAIPKGGSVLLTTVSQMTSPTVTTILAIAILMAIISTVDSLLCSMSSNLVFDFPILKKRKLIVAQAITFALGMSTFLLSFIFDNVLSMMIFSYELTAAVLFVPILMALIFKRGTRLSAILSMIFGAAALIGLNGVAYKELYMLLISLCGFGIGEAILYFQRQRLPENG